MDATPSPPTVHDLPAAAVRPLAGDGAPSQALDDLDLRGQFAAAARAQACYARAAAAHAQVQADALRRPAEAMRGSEALTQRLLDDLATPATRLHLLSAEGVPPAQRHAVNVAVLALLMARALQWNDDAAAEACIGALLHDIGHPPPAAGDGADPRDDAGHVEFGLAIGRGMGLTSGVLRIIAEHHELADRSGYPRGLGNPDLSPASRIVALVNRFEELCNPGDGSAALSPHAALAHLHRCAAGAYDATLLGAFIRLMGIYPPGTLVELTDGRHALVTSIDPRSSCRPRVLVHEPRAASGAVMVNLDHPGTLGIRRAVDDSALPPAAAGLLWPPRGLAFYAVPPGDAAPRQTTRH